MRDYEADAALVDQKALEGGCLDREVGLRHTMERSDLPELHFITRIENLPSILALGILSYHRAEAVSHRSFAMTDVQARRAMVRVPDGTRLGRPLHDFANLYIHARNVTMWVRRGEHRDLAVICIDPAALDIPGATVASCNAASYPAWGFGADGLRILDKDSVFTDDWRDPDPFVQGRQRKERCAEVLVPDVVPPAYFRAVRVSNDGTAARVTAMTSTLRIIVDRKIFFR